MRSDAALAERFAAGDEASFDVLYERHRPVVLAVAMGVLGTPQDAEDATQETFSALATALRAKPPAELRPWLIRVARNASIDTTRRRRHRLLTIDGEIPEIPARQPGAGAAELAIVIDGIRELPEGQRMALLMRELGGHTYAEIADFLATDEEAVKGLIARARVGLRSYREATEFPCVAAREAIATEPDGRRYAKTVRRHLRGCAACRSYREALRSDSKALRSALPIQAGSVATGGLSSSLLGAGKASLLGYGLTQAATTCAASACAVGALGGMVFVSPAHKLGLAPLFGPARTAPARVHAGAVRHRAARHLQPSASAARRQTTTLQGSQVAYRGAPSSGRLPAAAPARRLSAYRRAATVVPRFRFLHLPAGGARAAMGAHPSSSSTSAGLGLATTVPPARVTAPGGANTGGAASQKGAASTPQTGSQIPSGVAGPGGSGRTSGGQSGRGQGNQPGDGRGGQSGGGQSGGQYGGGQGGGGQGGQGGGSQGGTYGGSQGGQFGGGQGNQFGDGQGGQSGGGQSGGGQGSQYGGGQGSQSGQYGDGGGQGGGSHGGQSGGQGSGSQGGQGAGDQGGASGDGQGSQSGAGQPTAGTGDQASVTITATPGTTTTVTVTGSSSGSATVTVTASSSPTGDGSSG